MELIFCRLPCSFKPCRVSNLFVIIFRKQRTHRRSLKHARLNYCCFMIHELFHDAPNSNFLQYFLSFVGAACAFTKKVIKVWSTLEHIKMTTVFQKAKNFTQPHIICVFIKKNISNSFINSSIVQGMKWKILSSNIHKTRDV